MSKNESSDLTGFWDGREDADPLRGQLESLETLDTQGFCTAGRYPWDFWERRALEEGVSKELASLGRATMREAHQHAWEPLQRKLAGWEDDGETMLHLGLNAPEEAKFIWERLLETDGCRGSHHPETGEWISWV